MTPLAATERNDWLMLHDPLTIVVWHDAIVENFGYAPRSPYVETYWLPILGPSATWALRRLTAWLDAEPNGYELSLSEFGRELGIGGGAGRNATVVRTLARLVAFGIATPLGNDLAVRVMLAPLTRRHVEQLPPALAARHDADSASVLRPLPQRAPSAPANDGALSDTTSLVSVATASNDARYGDAGFGTADWSGKTTAVPPAESPCGCDGAGR